MGIGRRIFRGPGIHLMVYFTTFPHTLTAGDAFALASQDLPQAAGARGSRGPLLGCLVGSWDLWLGPMGYFT